MINSDSCVLSNICGGCTWRHLSQEDYRHKKETQVKHILRELTQSEFRFGTTVFIGDGTRRRATMAFKYDKGNLTLGFNALHSDEVLNCEDCLLLTPSIRQSLPLLRRLINDLCREPIMPNKKQKKSTPTYIKSGDISITSAANGLDVVLQISSQPTLNHRMIICEQITSAENIARVSWQTRPDVAPEPMLEKSKPFIQIAGQDVFLPAGTFLQPSKEGEAALIGRVLDYLGDTRGKIADLFCGVGTFSYPLAALQGNKIYAVDSSKSLLEGFRVSVNKNMLNNIEIETKNLFKYPLDTNELAGFKAVVFDPPRAGAEAQAKELAKLEKTIRPEKVIAVSCNPQSFVRDANILTNGGYVLQEITLVDQFIYSNHSELVALFTK